MSTPNKNKNEKAIEPNLYTLVQSLQAQLDQLQSNQKSNNEIVPHEENESDSGDHLSESQGRRYVDIPSLSSGEYDWFALEDCCGKSNEKKTKYPANLIVMQKEICKQDGINYCSFLNIPCNDENIENCLGKMHGIRHAVTQTIKNLLFLFWIDIGNELGLKINSEGGRKIRSINDLLVAVQTIKGYEEAVIVLTVFYLSFDWLPKYTAKIAEVVYEKHKIKIVEETDRRKNSKNFVEKLVSEVLNNERKNMNAMSINSNGYSFTITKYKDALFFDKGNRVKKFVYDWMIMGQMVSCCFFL
jgi:hypothetical protein